MIIQQKQQHTCQTIAIGKITITTKKMMTMTIRIMSIADGVPQYTGNPIKALAIPFC